MENIKEQVLSDIVSVITETSFKRFSVDVGTGVGKSYLMIQHMLHHYHEGATYLIVTPKSGLKKNFKDELKKFDALYLLNHIEFTTYLSFKKTVYNYDWIYFDECHSFKSVMHYRTLDQLQSNALALTGTFLPENTYEYEKFVNVFPVVYVYKSRNAVADKVLNDYRLVIHKIPLSKTIRVNSFNGYKTEMQGYIHWNAIVTNVERTQPFSQALQQLRITRMKFIQGCLSKVNYAKALSSIQKNKTIIFTESIEHCKIVCSDTYHSKNSKTLNAKNLDDFKDGSITKLSCVGQLNEGINIPELETGIILHSYANPTKTTQRIGRLLRLKPEENKVAIIHILVYQNTIDETWCSKALQEFDKSKIGYAPEDFVQALMKKANLLNND